MSRIRAGNTLANQYAPPFSVSDGVAAGWHLRWNNDLRAFEAYDPDPLNKEEAGFDSIQTYEVFASQQILNQDPVIIPWQVPSKEALIVTINGVKQHQNSYNINTVNYGNSMGVTFNIGLLDEPIEVGDWVEFTGLIARNPSNIRIRSFDAADYPQPPDPVQFILPWIAQSKESLIVTINGIKQKVSAYNISFVGTSTILTFNESLVAPQWEEPQPGDGIWLEVMGILDSPNVFDNPVTVQNLGQPASGPYYGMFKEQVNVGLLQVLNFRSLRAGTNIEIEEEVDDTYTISGRAVVNIGSGTSVLESPTPADGDPFRFRTIQGYPGEITIGLDNDSVVVRQNTGFLTISSTGAIPVSGRIIGVTASGITVTLPTPSNTSTGLTPPGTRILIKDQSNDATNNPIIINAASSRTIDGQTSTNIDTNFGWVEVYTDGNNWFIIG